MRGLFNNIVKQYLEFRYRKIEQFINNPHEAQQKVFRELMEAGKQTTWGKINGYDSIHSYKDFTGRVPICDYEDLLPYIKRMMLGEKNVLCPGQVKWYAKSSGTTSERSKFIPVSQETLKHCHIKGSWDSVAILYNNIPRARIFADKSLIMSGSLETYRLNPATRIGDVSAVMLKNMPLIGRPFFAPGIALALLDDWEEKIEKTANVVKDQNITTFGGVPTWTIVLFRKLLEITGKSNMLEIWPNAQTYVHGGVAFGPYRNQFQRLFPGDQLLYQEVYNASEGFFAVQHDLGIRDMMLLLDNGMYFEFIPEKELDNDNPAVVPLEGVKAGQSYAIMVSTNSGLWRYMPGDMVKFTSVTPFKIIITGRTNQYINVFGEEVMIANTDKALTETCKQFALTVNDYTVAPIYLDGADKGGHQWLIEFEEPPADPDHFADTLDKALRKVNSDYDAKRSHDLALERLNLVLIPPGTFNSWMKSRGKMGGQHKVPRLSNDRKHVEDIFSMMDKIEQEY